MGQGAREMAIVQDDGWTCFIKGASFSAHFGRTGASPMPTVHLSLAASGLGLAKKF